MQIFKEKVNRQSVLILEEIPTAFEIDHGTSATAHFKNEKKDHIGCIGCLNPRCMYFFEDETECNCNGTFANDKSVNVCPVEAVTWDDLSHTPIIDSKKCILCGICVSRCPVGALYFSSHESLMVDTTQSDIVEYKKLNDLIQIKHAHQIEQLLKVQRFGVSQKISDELFKIIYKKLRYIKSNYHNIIGRNLLIALGCKCSMPRMGDVYTRMDAIYCSPSGSFGVVEIEFGKDTLDASRGILDDIAVLNSRYGVNKHNNKPIVICLQLPNIRQGYWQVVKDIKNVVGIKIGTITIGALMYLLWNGCKFEPENDRYYIDYDNRNLREILCVQSYCDGIPLSDKALGIMEPMK